MHFKPILSKEVAQGWLRSVGCNTFDDISSAELTVSTAAHKVKLTIDCHKPSVTTSTHHLCDLLVERDPLGCVETLLLLVAELAIDAVAPGVSVAARVNIRRVLLSAGEIDNFALGCRGEDLLWSRLFQ